MSIRYLGKSKKHPVYEKRFWFGLFEQKELVCTCMEGKCYWTTIYWSNDIYLGCRTTISLSKEDARKELLEYKIKEEENNGKS
jgi:hypothetical protein